MVSRLEVVTGELVKKSSWGSGNVNGVSVNGCLWVSEYKMGYVVEVHPFFGGGKLWLDKNNLTQKNVARQSWFRSNRVELISNNDEVIVFGKLADIFN